MSETVLDALAAALDEAARLRRERRRAAGCAALAGQGASVGAGRCDARGSGERSFARRLRRPISDRGRRTGCAAWSRARSSSTTSRPGRRSSTCRGLSRGPADARVAPQPRLAPLAALQYRCQWFCHPNGRDWTIRALLHEQREGPRAAASPRTRRRVEALVAEHRPARGSADDASARRSSSTPTSSTACSTRIRSARSSTGSMTRPAARSSLGETGWSAFVQQCRQDFGFDPDAEGEIAGARKLGEAEGPWAEVWKRFAETPDDYPGIPDRLRARSPQELVPEESRRLAAGSTRTTRTSLRQALTELAAMSPGDARARRARARARAQGSARLRVGRSGLVAAGLRARAPRRGRACHRDNAARRARSTRSPTGTRTAGGVPTMRCCDALGASRAEARHRGGGGGADRDLPAVGSTTAARRSRQAVGPTADGSTYAAPSRRRGDGRGRRVRRWPSAGLGSSCSRSV